MEDADFDKLLQELQTEADQATWFLGFLTAIVDNQEIVERLSDSRSGFAGATAISGAKNSLILYCARAWDNDGDAISLRRAVDNLPSLEALEARRSNRISELQTDIPVGSLADRYRDFCEFFESVRDSPYHPTIRVLRSEYFAHRLLSSRDRDRFEAEGNKILDVTYDDLLKLATETLDLVGRVQYLWNQVVNPYPNRLERCTQSCLEFWRHVPKLKDVEHFGE